jgi:dihydrofolate reductase
VIGGAEIYAQWMAVADRLEITEVHAARGRHVFRRDRSCQQWEEVARVRNPAGPDDDSAGLLLCDLSPAKAH